MPLQPLPFRVCYCDSADERAPARNLERAAAHESFGWRSAASPRCPIEIGLQFDGRVRVSSVTLTSHQHLIPSSVELLVGAVVQRSSASSSQTAHTQADYVTATFQRLGFTRLDSNERSDYRAREVKTVHVNDATGHFLKLIVNEAHRNPRNPHGQVSLVSLVVEGTQELSDGVSAPGSVPRMMVPTDVTAFTHDAGLDVHFMQVGLDPSRAVDIVPLMPFQMPGEDEDADAEVADAPSGVVEAATPATPRRRSVDESSEPKVVLPKRAHAEFFENAMRSLAEEKVKAVTEEEYERANAVKAGLVEVTALGAEVERAEAAKDGCVLGEDYDGAVRLKAQVVQLVARAHSVIEQLRATKGQPVQQAPQFQAPPAVVASRSPERELPSSSTSEPPQRSSSQQPPPPQQQQSQTVAEPLDEVVRKEKARLIELFGLYTVQCLLSSHRELRAQGLNQVAQTLADQRLPRLEPAVLHEAALQTAIPTIRDESDDSVFDAAIEVVKLSTAAHATQIASSALQAIVDPVLGILLDRACDEDRSRTTERSSIAAQQACLQLATGPEHPDGAFLAEALGGRLVAASAAAGKAVGPAAAVPRLQLFRDVMPQLHGRPGGGDGGAASTLPAVSLGLASDEAAVRSAAVETAAAAYKRLGRARVESALLAGDTLKPALRQVLEMTFRGIDQSAVAHR
jgi:hypothetical protein